MDGISARHPGYEEPQALPAQKPLRRFFGHLLLNLMNFSA
jgi:hypothetical protein